VLEAIVASWARAPEALPACQRDLAAEAMNDGMDDAVIVAPTI
jgi:hypothetical protein